MKKHAVLISFVLVVSAVLAADPPSLVNYQGVLRDSLDKPRAGTFDMVFRFFDASTAGNEVLVDSHTGGGGNAVTVSGGLFNVQLGGGTVTDGSGAGTYTSIDQVFRDYGSAWLEIKVGAETLSPRVRVQSAAYALNASNLQGKNAASFLDTSVTSQTKGGRIAIADPSSSAGYGLTVSTPAGAAVYGSHTVGGAQGYLGYNTIGVWGQGSFTGGFFADSNNTGSAYVGYGDYGVWANGNSGGGYFYDNSGSAVVAAGSGYGLDAYGTAFGIWGHGVGGGYFTSQSGTGSAWTGYYNTGVLGYGSPGGYYFTSGSGVAYLASGDYGVKGYGTWPNGAAGYFKDLSYTGEVWLGDGDTGIVAQGSYSAGEFTRTNHSVRATLGTSDYFGQPVGLHAYSNSPGEYPAFFHDYYFGNYAFVGDASWKIDGNGSVSFLQNHPFDPNETIVYTAPEGDETAVYTRGTARLVHGDARVKLGDTFAWVTNPDIGLTAQLTPRGVPVALAVSSLTASELVVRGPVEAGDVVFDYLVYGLRIGFEERAVVQKKRQEAFIPSHEVDEVQYSGHEDLRQYNALSRFSKMRDDVGAIGGAPVGALDLTASKALESAIHVYDRSVDGTKGVGPESAPQPKTPQSGPSPLADPGNVPVFPPPSPLAPGAAANTPAPPIGDARTSAVATDLGPAYPPNTTPVTVVEPVEAGDVLSNAHPVRATCCVPPSPRTPASSES